MDFIVGVLWTHTFPLHVVAVSKLVTGIPLRIDVWFHCKVSAFLVIFFLQFSSGLLVIMSLEKFLVLHFPLKKSNFSTVKIAKRMSIGLAVFYALINCPMIYLYEPFDTPFGKVCSVAKSNIKYHSIYFKGASVMYSFIPFVFIGIANVAIIYKFMNVKFIRGHGSTSSTNQALSRAGMRGTAILITVSLTFLFLTAPVSFYGAFMGTIRPTLLFSVLEASGNLNHAIKLCFILYSGYQISTWVDCSIKMLQKRKTRKIGLQEVWKMQKI